jgi:hypothetical protein
MIFQHSKVFAAFFDLAKSSDIEGPTFKVWLKGFDGSEARGWGLFAVRDRD